MLVNKENIASILPQRNPMIMVDCLLESSKNCTITSFEILESNIFTDQGLFLDAGLIENMAQTAIAGGAYQFLKNDSTVARAFFGEIKSLEIINRAKIGDIIKTKTEILKQALNISLVKAEAFCNDKLLAQCQMKLVIE